MRARILIADDHDIVRKGIRNLIEESPHKDWEICGEASNGHEALEAVNKLRPDIVILDIAMPEVNGLDATTQISKKGLNCRVLLFTMYASAWLGAEARRIGARGYVLKSQGSRDLIEAIERLLEGGTFFGTPKRPSERESGGLWWANMSFGRVVPN